MRKLLPLLLVAALPVLAQEKPAATADDSAARDAQSASGGATAPRPNFRRDAPASQALFDRLDKNRDGYLTGSELTTSEALSSNWIAVDRDTDGRISREEFSVVDPGSDVARK